MKQLSTQKTMTVKEVAEIMGISTDTVTRAVKKLYPEKMKQGGTTRLNELELTEINVHIKSNRHLRRTAEVTTELEMSEMALKVMQYQIQKINTLKQEVQTLKNDVKLLVHDFKKTYTTTEIAKELNLKSAQVLNTKLVEEKIQFKRNGTWVLYSQYADKNYTSIKETKLDTGQVVYDRLWTGIGRQFILNHFNRG